MFSTLIAYVCLNCCTPAFKCIVRCARVIVRSASEDSSVHSRSALSMVALNQSTTASVSSTPKQQCHVIVGTAHRCYRHREVTCDSHTLLDVTLPSIAHPKRGHHYESIEVSVISLSVCLSECASHVCT